jgi:hypothetical protein
MAVCSMRCARIRCHSAAPVALQVLVQIRSFTNFAFWLYQLPMAVFRAPIHAHVQVHRSMLCPPARARTRPERWGGLAFGGACAADAVGLSLCTEQTAFVCRSTTSRTRRMRCTPRRSSSRSSCRTTVEGRRARSTSTAVRPCHICTATGLTPPLSLWHFAWVLTCAALFCVQMCACARAGVCTHSSLRAGDRRSGSLRMVNDDGSEHS